MDKTQARRAVQDFVNADRWSELEAAIWQNRDALFGDEAPALFQQLRDAYRHKPDALALIDRKIEQFEILRQRGIRSLYAHLQGYGREMVIMPELMEALRAVRTVEEQQDLLDRHPELIVVVQHLSGAKNAAPLQPSHCPQKEMQEVLQAQTAPPARQIDVAQRAIQATDRHLFPEFLGDLYQILGKAWSARSDIDRDQRLTESEACFAAAEGLMPRQERPIEWARLQAARANALITNGAATAAGLTQRTIRHFEQALEFLREDLVPSALDKAVLSMDGKALARERASIAIRLVELYCQRPNDAHLDLTRAEVELRDALELFSGEDDTANEAQTRLLLAQIIAERPSDDPDESIAVALSELRLALALARRCGNDRLAAIANLRIGALKRRDVDLADWDAHLAEARGHFTAAAEGLDASRDPEFWAQARFGLVAIEADRPKSGDFDQVRALLDDIFNLGGPADHAHLKAAAHAALANAHRKWLGKNPDADLAEAKRHMQQAIRHYDADSFPHDTREVFRELGELLLDEGDWRAAYEAFGHAIAITESLISGTSSVEGLRHEINRAARLYAPATYCLVRLHKLDAALPLLERSRSRLFSRLARFPDATVAPDPEPLNFGDILATVPEGGACVVFIQCSAGSMAIVVPADARNLSEDHVVDLAFSDFGSWKFLQGKDDGGWLNGLMQWSNGGDYQQWLDEVKHTCGRLWTDLMQPVFARLQALGLAENAPVLLLPTGPIAMLPLHAAAPPDAGPNVPFLDTFTLSYATGFSSLHQPPAGRELPAKLTSVVDPSEDLPFAAMEHRLIAECFAPEARQQLQGSAATVERFLNAIPGSTYLNLACHGYFHWREPENSALVLAGNRTLSLRDLVSSELDLRQVRLVTLAGCETGVPQIYRRVVRNVYVLAADEPISVPMVWTAAGARAVVSALWPIDDFPTALLIGEFYRRHIAEGKTIALALREAQNWLRSWGRDSLLARVEEEMRTAEGHDGNSGLMEHLENIQELLTTSFAPGDFPFDHPYYWAAFTAMGDAQTDQAKSS